jgi:hypothetical protein
MADAITVPEVLGGAELTPFSTALSCLVSGPDSVRRYTNAYSRYYLGICLKGTEENISLDNYCTGPQSPRYNYRYNRLFAMWFALFADANRRAYHFSTPCFYVVTRVDGWEM